jgi:hypothetical protein
MRRRSKKSFKERDRKRRRTESVKKPRLPSRDKSRNKRPNRKVKSKHSPNSPISLERMSLIEIPVVGGEEVL